MPQEERLIEISRTLGRIEGRFDGVEARFEYVNSRLDYQDSERDKLDKKLDAILERPKARRRAVMKWGAGAAASLLASAALLVLKGCVGH